MINHGSREFEWVCLPLFLAKLGRAMGWEYTQFWPEAHHVHNAEKRYPWVFIPALRHFGRLSKLEAMDKKGKWASMMDTWHRVQEAGDPAFAEEHRFDNLARLIFPELSTG